MLPFNHRPAALSRAVYAVLMLLIASCAPAATPPAVTVTMDARDLPSPTATYVPTVEVIVITATPPPPTQTPAPTFTPTITDTPTDTPTATPLPRGSVEEGRGGLRMRSLPNDESWILGNLPEGSEVIIVGRTIDDAWLEVQTTDGVTGWVWGSYILTEAELASVEVTNDTVTFPTPVTAVANAGGSGGGSAASAAGPGSVISNLTGVARDIYLRGQGMGNRAAVFSKVGDSLTVATYVLYPYGWRTYDLGGYTYYQPAVDYFSSVIARDGYDSFGNVSLAADNGWTTRSVLDPARATPGVCQSGESPLVCEYRVVRPSVALVMFGTNDVGNLSADEFSANLSQIVQISNDRGVIPVLCTIPARRGFEAQVQQFNAIIRGLAVQAGVPLMDYYSAMLPLPNNGLSDDGIHPSWPPGEYSDAARFTGNNLQYGYTVRNFTALQALDAVWRQIMY